MTISISFYIFFPDIFRHLIELSVRIVWCVLINQSCVRSKKPCFVRNLQEVVNAWINTSASYPFCPYHKIFHYLLHIPVRLRLHDDRLAATQSWHIKVKHIRCLHIGNLSKDIHKLRQIGKFIEPALETETTALNRKLQCCCYFSEVSRPRVEMMNPHFLKCRFLQIKLHNIHFTHRIAYRCSGSKHNASAIIYL